MATEAVLRLSREPFLRYNGVAKERIRTLPAE